MTNENGRDYRWRCLTFPVKTQDKKKLRRAFISMDDKRLDKSNMTERIDILLDFLSAQGMRQALLNTDGHLLVATPSFFTHFNVADNNAGGLTLDDLRFPADITAGLKNALASIAAARGGLDGQHLSVPAQAAGCERLVLKPQKGGRQVLLTLEDGPDPADRAAFLSTAVHDLRQPFQAMHLFHHLLEARVAGTDLEELVGRLGQAVTGGEALLSSIFDVLKLDARQPIPQIEEVVFDEVLADLLEEFTDEAEAKGIRLNIRPSEAVVAADRGLLHRLLRALTSNAVRFTSHGGVLIGTRRRDDRLRIEIWDTGTGIDAAHHQLIFGDFKQVESGKRPSGQAAAKAAKDLAGKNLGAGLGLSIAGRLAKAMGLTISIRSVPERGSVFSVEVPLMRLSSANADHGDDTGTSVADRAAGQATVLVIEDDDIQLQGMDLLLTGWGYDVIPSHSLAEACANLARDRKSPDLVLSDLRLAGTETGVEAIGAIRRRFGDRLPGVIITGDTDPARLKMADRSGYSVLHKPCQPSQLRATLVDAMGR